MAYRDYVPSGDNGLFFNYNPQNPYLNYGGANPYSAPSPAAVVGPAGGDYYGEPNAQRGPLSGFTGADTNVGISPEQQASNAISMKQSDATMGAGSIGKNFSSGNIPALIGSIAAMMAPFPVGLITSMPSLAKMIGAEGPLTGQAVSNQNSTGNAARDLERIIKANSIEQTQLAPPMPVQDPINNQQLNPDQIPFYAYTALPPEVIPIEPNPAPDPEGEAPSAESPDSAEAAAATGEGPGTATESGPGQAGTSSDSGDAGTGADAGTGSGAADAGDSGSAWAAGGAVHYQRFKEGGSPRRPIKNPRNNDFPAIWDNPRETVLRAVENVAPEDPAMRQLFGHSRDSLYEQFKDRVGNKPGMEFLPHAPKKPTGSAAVEKIITPGNTQRLVDTLGEAGRYSELHRGMDSWYAMDPVHQRLTELHGPDMADYLYNRFNTFTGMASAGSSPGTEINRGSAANVLHNQGRFGEFAKYANTPFGEAPMPGTPADIAEGVMGHPYHSTAHVRPMQNFVDTDQVNMSKAKVPLYIGASSVPSLGFQTDMPVPDSHFSRGIGLADTRTNAAPNASATLPEAVHLAPWWKDSVARAVGLEAVPAQARLWGTLAPATGVRESIGAPKLELLSRHIMERAKKLGVEPADMRDMLISGERFGRGGLASYAVD